MKKLNIFIGAVALLPLLSGCASSSEQNKSNSTASIDEARFLRLINDSAKVIADAARVRASQNNYISNASSGSKGPEKNLQSATRIPKNMGFSLPMFEEEHDLENIIQTITTMTGYDIDIVNKVNAPRNKLVIIDISSPRTAYQYIADIAAYVDDYADIKVIEYDPLRKTEKNGIVKVIYK